MDNRFYQTIFKRKSFHVFRNTGEGRITEEDLLAIREAYDAFEPLYPDIRTAIRIVPATEVNLKRDAEYCIQIYSEKKDNYLVNAGYIGEQLDLWLVDRNIGTLWYGLGKTDEPTYDGLEYVIMIAIRKVDDESLFRKDMFKANRKATGEIWEGDTLGVAEIAKYAPSAVNSQPWFVKNEGDALTVFRYKKPGRIGIMSVPMVAYFNRIDIGIFLCILEICLAQKQIGFTRELFIDDGDGSKEFTKVAVYKIENA